LAREEARPPTVPFDLPLNNDLCLWGTGGGAITANTSTGNARRLAADTTDTTMLPSSLVGLRSRLLLRWRRLGGDTNVEVGTAFAADTDRCMKME
jgi:hypothetical protein